MRIKSDRHEREMDLFYQLITADPARRRALLDQACAGNANLRERMEKLLAIQAAAERFFADAAEVTILRKEDFLDEK